MSARPERSQQASVVRTDEEFCAWVGQEVPGDTCVYHTGFLMIDADHNTSRLRAHDRDVLVALRDRVQEASELGLVRLFQRRIGDGRFEYIAVASVPQRHHIQSSA